MSTPSTTLAPHRDIASMFEQKWKIFVAFVSRWLKSNNSYTVTSRELKRKCGFGADYYPEFEKFAKSERERPFTIIPRYPNPEPLEFEFRRK